MTYQNWTALGIFVVVTMSNLALGLVVTWDGWDGLNETTAYNSTDIEWRTDLVGNCTLTINATRYTNIHNYTYDETADSTYCYGTWEVGHACASAYDSNAATYGADGALGDEYDTYLTTNYTKPTGADVSSKWWVKDGAGSTNLTLSAACFAQAPLQFRVVSVDTAGLGGGYHHTYWDCWDGAAWSRLRDALGTSIYEEGMWWDGNNGTVFRTSVSNLAEGNYTLNTTCDRLATTVNSTNVWWDIDLPNEPVPAWAPWDGWNDTYTGYSIIPNWTTSIGANNCSLTFGYITYNSIRNQQEHANTAYTVDALGSMSNIANLYDGNWSTLTTLACDGTSYYYANYTKPNSVTSAYSSWQVKDGNGTANLTLPNACWTQTPVQFKLSAICATYVPHMFWYCYDGSAWTQLREGNTSSAYEERMFWGNQTQFNKTITQKQEGNYTLSISCNNTGGMGTSTNAWVYMNTINLVSPTPANNTQSNGSSWIYVNATPTFDSDNCLLDWNGTNITMAKDTTTHFYLNRSEYTNGTYLYNVWCNDTAGDFYYSELLNYTINTSNLDILPPVVTYVSPTNNTDYASSQASTNKYVDIYTNEEVDECWWDDSNVAIGSMTHNFTSVNNLLPGYRNRFEATLPSAGSAKYWYIRCNDTAGNAMTSSTEIRFSVSAYASGGGGGGTTTTAGDNFVLYRPGGDAACVGQDYCFNSLTFDSATGAYKPIALRTCSDRILAARDGLYTVCNIAGHASTISLVVTGYSTSYGSTEDFLSLNTTKLELENGTCGSFQVKAKYPSGAVGSFSNSESRPFAVTISGVEKIISIPVEEMKADCPAIEAALFENICWGEICMPPMVWFLFFFVIVVVFLASRR